MSTGNFYQNLRPFSDFEQFTDDAHFHPVPFDWHIVITDVSGSTQAIAEGRYKDVNMIGAAAIVCCRKAMPDGELPFTFGGDGATFIFTGGDLERVLPSLQSLKRLAAANFGLNLRVGSVPVAALLEGGHRVEVAKYELTPGQSIAIFRGDGFTAAERRIKECTQPLQIPGQAAAALDLSALSCRWQPIPSRRGRVLSMIIRARQGDVTYESVLSELNGVMPEGIGSYNPANIDMMAYKSFRESLGELRLQQQAWTWGWFKRLLAVLTAVLIFKGKVPLLIFDRRPYQRSIRPHSDFRKFDDTLRMTIDCSAEQVRKIRRCLQSLYDSGKIHYGLFETDSSLMTCFVEGLGQGKHIHFIDANNGGYASAAQQMKQQMSAEATEWRSQTNLSG